MSRLKKIADRPRENAKEVEFLLRMKRLKKVASYNTLIIVDVQKEFTNCITEEYMENVKKYVEKNWDSIIIIVDYNMGEASIPDFLYHNANKILTKNYGFDFEYIKELEEEGQIEEIEEDEVYRYNNELVVRGNIHEWFNVPEDMELCFKELQTATIIGGGDGECLDDVESSLNYLGVEVNRGPYIYGYIENNDTYYAEEINWIEV